jgi:hypothetical protein
VARRFLGADEAEIREALAALRHARGIGDLQRLVESLPVMREPGFQTALRGIYLNSQEDTENLANQSFTALYDDLIYLLHRRSYAERCEQAKTDPCLASAVDIDWVPPRLYRAICVAIADHLAEVVAVAPMDPDRDRAELEHLLDELLGECPPLPEYEPERGVSWSLLVVACAGCETRRAVSHAHAIDLVARSDLQRDLREGRFEDAGCAACGEVRCAPVSVLLDESPASGDPLGALSCVVRLAADALVFRPPPGTVDEPELRRLLEMRFSRWLDKSGWRSDSASDDAEQGRILMLSTAYSSADMADRLDDFAEHDVPLAMKQIIEELTTKLRTGEASFGGVQLFLDRSAPLMAGWPVLPGSTDTALGLEWHHIVHALIAERVAAVQDAPIHVRALLAVNTAAAYLALYESAAADQSLHRAADMLALADADDPNIAAVRTAVAHGRADLLDHTGDAAGAARLRLGHDASEILGRDQEVAQLARLDLRLREAADALGNQDLATALAVLPDMVDTLRELTTIQPRDRDDDRLQPMYLHRLCGALGNLGGTLGELASHLDAVRRIYGEDLQDPWPSTTASLRCLWAEFGGESVLVVAAAGLALVVAAPA